MRSKRIDTILALIDEVLDDKSAAPPTRPVPEKGNRAELRER